MIVVEFQNEILLIADAFIPLTASAVSVLADVAILFLMLLGPFAVFAIIIHWLERTIQTRLAERFGWKSVLWTGWLGTPIHELSHAIMCKVFRHRIDDMALFEPDKQSGRLGYVRHSWTRGNWYEEIGNVFIGIAPLMGGSITLIGLLWLFFPEAAGAALEIGRSSDEGVVGQTLAVVETIFASILEWRNFGTAGFWVFIYLVLCVGSHMAPSRSDYRGAGKGAVMLLITMLAVGVLVSIMVADIPGLSRSLAGLFSPLFAVMLLTIALCSFATILVSLFVRMFTRKYSVS